MEHVHVRKKVDVFGREKRILVMLICGLTNLWLLPYAVNAVLSQAYQLASMLAFCSVLLLICLFFLMREGPSQIIRYLCAATFIILYVYLLIEGGPHGSALIWGMLFGAIIFQVLSYTMGLVVSLIILVSTYIGLYYLPQIFVYQYPPGHAERFIFAYLAVCFLSFFNDWLLIKAHTEIKQAKEDYQYLAQYDELTQLANRRYMGEVLKERERRKNKTDAFSLLIADIDFFKKINDTYGHDAGDVVLVRVAQTIQNTLRSEDMAARWGGEEFLILLRNTSLKGAKVVAEKVRQAICNLCVEYDNQVISLTLSIGGTTALQEMDINHMIKLADANLYQAKASGRNTAILTAPLNRPI